MSKSRGSILLTGAGGDLGSAIVSKIISAPEFRRHHGIYAARNVDTPAPNLDAALKVGLPQSSSPGLSHSYEKISLDLSRLANVRTVAASINNRIAIGELPPIRVLILNAGYEEFRNQTWTEDGLDTTFVVNYLSQWLLAILLLQSIDKSQGRVVWISSFSHNTKDIRNVVIRCYHEDRYKTMISNDLEPIAKGTWSPNSPRSSSRTWVEGYRRYGSSKLCGVTMIYELQRRLDRDTALNDISVLAIDPGSMGTGIARRSSSWFLRVVMFRVVIPILGAVMVYFWPNGTWRTLDKSSGDVVSAAFNLAPPPLSERPKSLYLDGSKRGEHSSEASDPLKGQAVWKGSVKYADLKEGDTVLQDWK
ncbi:putative short-chain dehydrogenase [Hypoxylon sp. NC1633]|nr:putative short-chain dehydrogenase [Hypoxylon sp. NC1633]